jgi:nucleoside-diphosphate-sugar epimerase
MGDRLMGRIIAGKSVQVFGATDVEHSWTSISDVARTLVAAATEPTAWGRAWHVPSVAPMTQQDLVHHLCEIAGVAPAKVGVLPNAILAIAGLFVPPIREMAEMRYQFVEPFVIDATDTTAAFGIEATPLAETLRAMVDHARGVPAALPVAA